MNFVLRSRRRVISQSGIFYFHIEATGVSDVPLLLSKLPVADAPEDV
ncbi:hypothetical protein [Calothrix sp. NIES-2100]